MIVWPVLIVAFFVAIVAYEAWRKWQDRKGGAREAARRAWNDQARSLYQNKGMVPYEFPDGRVRWMHVDGVDLRRDAGNR